MSYYDYNCNPEVVTDCCRGEYRPGNNPGLFPVISACRLALYIILGEILLRAKM